MPCYDSRSDPSYVRYEARKEFRHNSDVAEMLCRLCKVVDPLLLDHETHQWWVEHQTRDAAKAAK